MSDISLVTLRLTTHCDVSCCTPSQTNKNKWLTVVKKNMKNDGWNAVTTRRDLKLSLEAKDMDMAVDMEIAIKAFVFTSNGAIALSILDGGL